MNRFMFGQFWDLCKYSIRYVVEIEDPVVISAYRYVLQLQEILVSAPTISKDYFNRMCKKYKRHCDKKKAKNQHTNT